MLLPTEQYNIAMDILLGLNYLHHKGYVHADLKSANILLDRHGRAKLADFGLTKTSIHSIENIADKSTALPWCAPETLSQFPQITSASDIFAYGTLLWEVVTGKKPYAQYKDKDKELLQALLQGKRESLENIPKFFAQLIQACWLPNPEERPSAVELLKNLRGQTRTLSQMITDGEEAYLRANTYKSQKDDVNAVNYYQKASETGHGDALAQLGLYSICGKGIAQDKKKAFAYFEQSAKKGNVTGMFNLGQMLEYEKEIGIDLNAALQWYQKAVEGGHSEASVRLARVKEKLKEQSKAKVSP